MKQTDETNVGGRVRKARTDANLSIKGLSGVIEVTAVYLGMVERGEKKPSANLLQRIAQATGVSAEWLENDVASKTELPEEAERQSQPTVIPINIDATLFLHLVIQTAPNMTKEKLAVMLDVSSETVDEILSGRSGKYAFRWADVFSLLARRMDIPAACQKIRDIDLFLQHENTEKKRKCLYDSLKRYAGSEYQYFAPPTMQKNDGKGLSGSGGLYFESIILKKNEEPGEEDWHFIFCRFEGGADEFPVDVIIRDVLSGEREASGKRTYVFEDEEIIDSIKGVYEDRQAKNDAAAEIDGRLCHSLPPVSLLLVDDATWEYKKDILLEDNGEFQ